MLCCSQLLECSKSSPYAIKGARGATAQEVAFAYRLGNLRDRHAVY